MATRRERSGPLLLLDGMSLAFRAYFALPDTLATSTGLVTNAVHGFTSMLVYLIREQRPSALAVAFDAPGDTFRDEMLEDYKAGRADTPWLLPPQFDMIRAVMASLAIPVIEAPGFEADDVIATLATEAAERQCEVVIVTGDRDSFQLVSDPYVRVLYNKRGVSDYALYDEAGIFERCGVPPSQYVLLASLRGDPSDNLPGVPGVGEKTAAKLLTNYGDLDGIFGNLDALTPKLRENLAANEELARSNARHHPPRARRAPRRRRCPPAAGWVGPRHGGGHVRAPRDEDGLATPGGAARRRRTGRAAPGSAGPKAEGAAAAAAAPVGAQAHPAAPALELRDVALPTSASDVTKHLSELGSGPLAMAARWNGNAGPQRPGRARPRGDRGRGGRPGGHGPGRPARRRRGGQGAERGPRPPLRRPSRQGGHAVAAPTGRRRDRARGWTPAWRRTCSMRRPASTSWRSLREQTGQLSLDITEPGTGALDVAREAAGEAADVAGMATGFRQRLESEDMVMLHDDIETPLVRVLAKMEVAGIGIDRAELQAIADSLKASVATLQAEVQECAGHEFNVNSTPQLRTVLYEEIGLTPGKKTKTGFSTDAQTLESLRGAHPIIDASLLPYREVEKLRSTYGESLLAEVQADGRIHASFGQTVARTGRISSDRPNLHNIPVRTELGKQFRRAFVPAEGSTFLVADYDQVELRCIAHLSEDPGLIDARPAGRTCTGPWRPRCTASTPPTSRTPSASSPKMVADGLSCTAWRPTG